MKILALDLASRTGLALGSSIALIRSWSQRLTESSVEGEDEVRRLVALGLLVEDIIEGYGVRHVVCEGAIPPRGVEMQTNILTTQLAFGLCAIAKTTAMRMGCSYSTVPASTWRKHFVGFGNSDKDDALKRNHQLGFMPADKDESDAIGILSYELRRLRQTPAWDDRDGRGKPVLPFPSRDPVQLPAMSERAALRKAGVR